MKKQWFFLFILIIIFSIGCDDPIPINEMTLAHQEIKKAADVNAGKYASEEYTGAKDALLVSHTQVKDEKIDQATESAKESYKLANSAYLKSLPLLAKDTMVIAEKSIKAADDVYAEKLASEDYIKAKEEFASSNQQYNNKEYYKSYKSALDADKYAKNARMVAIGKRGVLQDAITEVKNTLTEAKIYGAEQSDPQKYKLATEYVAIAEKAEADENLREGFSAVEVAKLNADESYLTALRTTSEKKLDEANTAIEAAKKSAGAESAGDELQGAKESYTNAKLLHGDTRYKESISASGEAIKLAGEVSSTEPVAKVEKIVEEKPSVDKEKSIKSDDYNYYTVRSWIKYRDCLWSISRKYYKNPRLWKKIYKANKDRIGNPNIIRPGWKIRIPKLKK